MARFSVHRLLAPLKMFGWGQPRLGSGPARRARLLLARHRRALAVCLALLALWVTIRTAAPAKPSTVTVLVAAQDLPAGHRLTRADLQPRAWPAAARPSGLLNVAAGQMLATPIRAGELLTDARVLGPGLLAGQPSGIVAMPVRLGDPMAGALVRAGDRVDVLVSAGSDWASQPDFADGTQPTVGTGPAEGTEHVTGAEPADGVAATEAGSSASSPGAAERVVSSALVLAVPGSGSADSADVIGAGSGGLGGLGGGDAGGGGDPGGGGVGGGVGSGVGTTAGGMAGDGSDRVIVLAVSSPEARRLAAAQTGRFITIAMLPRA